MNTFLKVNVIPNGGTAATATELVINIDDIQMLSPLRNKETRKVNKHECQCTFRNNDGSVLLAHSYESVLLLLATQCIIITSDL